MNAPKNKLILLNVLYIAFYLVAANAGYCECNGQPQEVVKQYYTELANKNFEKALIYITNEDRKLIKTDRMFEKPYDDLIEAVYRRTTFKVINTTLNDNKAILVIRLKAPNYGASLGENIAGGIGNINEHKFSPKEVWQKTLDDIKSDDFEYIEFDKKFTLICEENSWKIFLNAINQKKINEIMKLGLRAVTEKNYTAATSYFKQILDLDKDNKLATICLERIERSEDTGTTLEKKMGHERGADGAENNLFPLIVR